MITCEVTEEFTLNDFDKLKEVKRTRRNEKGRLFIGDTFKCDLEMAKYLLGDNQNKKVVVKVLEVIPEQKSKE